MSKMRGFIALCLLLAGTATWAQKTDGLIVTSGNAERQFVIGEVKEITFSDEGMTVITADDAAVVFAADWQIRFGELDATGISFAGAADSKDMVQVLNVEGKLMREAQLTDLRASDLPKGVYLIRCNGKTFKRIK